MVFEFEQTADRMAEEGIGTDLVDMGYTPVMGSMDSYINTVWLVLLTTCPVDTGRMVSNMRLENIYIPNGGIMAKISISAVNPKSNYHYPLAVNEGLSAEYQHRPMSYKEQRNFHWVQKSLTTAAKLHMINANVEDLNDYTFRGEYEESNNLLFGYNEESW